jgi:hypothetical protein
MVELFANDISFGSIINQGVGVAKEQRKRTSGKILVIRDSLMLCPTLVELFMEKGNTIKKVCTLVTEIAMV